ncbi:hypothetical protein CHS0354_018559 [Potamilus streckersoni]|uniref:tryptophan synthase n=1 Tax=Potamilus streckersoni TaxID=2493646 RepID=A0AAE0TBH4_9BIVA|nr:hypothetical protein CHS0354_018559 [Potamilus streckersoni]
MDAPHPGALGGTFGGNPVSCAAALAVIEVMEKEGLLARSVQIGEIITSRMKKISAESYGKSVSHIRGLGGMTAFEFLSADEKPDADKTKLFVRTCREQGLIILPCGIYNNAVRILVPLTRHPPTVRRNRVKSAVAPDKNGFYGEYGGCYIPEILRPAIEQLAQAFQNCKTDTSFREEFLHICQTFSNRPTPLTFAENTTRRYGTAKVYIKREDLNQTGAHKFNNVAGQGLLAKRMGKKRIIAETGAGQHGVATATIAAKMGFACTVYMGEEDVRRQYPNVFWMKQLGAHVVPVTSGTAILKDAINEAMRDWSANPDDTHYVMGTACGPHPFPEMVSYFQSVVGEETREQILRTEKRLPARVYACVGGGSNAMGIFSGFLDDAETEKVGVEAGGYGITSGKHAIRFGTNESCVGIAQGYKTLFLQNQDGQMRDTHSVSAGLDYVGVSPILAYLQTQGKIRITHATDEATVAAAREFIRTEGIIPALESAHAFAAALAELPALKPDDIIIICQSGRGDKDIFTVAEAFGDKEWKQYIQEKHAQYTA